MSNYKHSRSTSATLTLPRLRGFTEQEREQEEERLALDRLDCASVMSEPARNPAAEQVQD